MRIVRLSALWILVLAASTQSRAWQKADAQQPAAKAARQKGDTSPPLIQSIQGPDLYRAYCASCHGLDAKGGGPMAPSLKVKAADLTRISARNGGVFPKARLERIISGEDQPMLGHGSSEMPVWGPIFSKVTKDVDLGLVRIDNLTLYLNSIQTK